jgi:glycosyltransferase involved in cell wall biosynthesis
MKYQKITIITPSFNQAQFLEQSIQSVINQNYPNLEYIIIDGGSTDGSVDIIKKYEKYITYWISEKDNGQSDAINKGLKIATGDIVNWLCSDDSLEPQSLYWLNQTFQKTNADYIAGATKIINYITRKTNTIPPPQKKFVFQIPSRMPFPQPSFFYSKKILQNNLFVHHQLHYAMDMELLTRTFFSHEQPHIFFTNKILSQYIIHPKSKSGTLPLDFFPEWASVFFTFCKKMNFHLALNIINDLNLKINYYPDLLNTDFPSSVIKKYHNYEKYFLAYFLKYQLFYHIEISQFDKSKMIIKTFQKYLPDFYYKWLIFRYHLSILKRKI